MYSESASREERISMPTYVNLIRFTEQGVANYADTVRRAQNYWASIEASGGRVREEFWIMGEYDIIVSFDAPDDETATALALGVSALGDVRTTTMRAFTSEEMGRIIERGS